MARNRAVDVLIIIGTCILLDFVDLGRAPFYDKQEAREALVVREIVQSGNWILPLRNGNEVPSKPPLYHWLAALIIKPTGPLDELTLRLPSAIFATAGALLVYAVGTTLGGRSAGLIAAIVLTSSFEWRQAAKAVRVDMTLTFVLLCCFVWFLEMYRSGGGRSKAALLGVLLGMATLAKGPLGVVVPCFAYFIFLLLRRDLGFIRKMHPIVLICTCAAVALSWYVLAFVQGGRDFLDVVIKENFSMVIGEDAGHPHPFFWYVPAFFNNAAPWSIFVIPVGVWLYRSRHDPGHERLLYYVVWFCSVVIFFSIFRQKRSVYILSAYPAFALLFGVWWKQLTEQQSSRRQWLAQPAVYLHAATFLILGVTLGAELLMNGAATKMISSRLYPKDQAQLAFIGDLVSGHSGLVAFWAIACAVGGTVLVFCGLKAFSKPYIVCASVLMIISYLVVQRFDTDLARHYSFKRFLARVTDAADGEPLYFCGSEDYAVAFYAGRPVPLYDVASHATGPFYMLCWENEWNQIRGTAGLKVDDASEVRDYQVKERGYLYLVAVNKSDQLDRILKEALRRAKKEGIKSAPGPV